LSPRYKPIGETIPPVLIEGGATKRKQRNKREENEKEVTAQIILDEAVQVMSRENSNIEVTVAQDFMEVEIPRKFTRNVVQS